MPFQLQSERVSFTGSEGRRLAGILDRPPVPPIGHVLMAHCFTCSKDLKATVRIARGLAELGWGVLRFDFAGLGNSEGDFSKTNFRSNQEDLRGAYRFLAAQQQTPMLLFGHSFGGAAAMSMANELEAIRGVIALAAPSDTAHLADVLVRLDPAIETTGYGKVRIGGQLFPIARQMLDDFRSFDLAGELGRLTKPLMIFHSPSDATLGYHHALRIYSLVVQAERLDDEQGPEVSLITLPKSDHLLTNNPRDISLVVGMIDVWGRRLSDSA